MNKIALVGVISIIFSFSLFFIFEWIYDEGKTITATRYPRIIDDDKKKIALLGSSQTYQINATSINERLKIIDDDYYVYNFGMFGNLFKENVYDEKHYEIVVYGISYRDFYENKNKENFLDINRLFSIIILKFFPDLGEVNPKGTTLLFIRNIIGNKETFPDPIDKLIQISDNSYLRSQIQYSEANFNNIPPLNENYKAKKFVEEIELIKSKGIKIIIFNPPFHKYYLDLLSEDSKNNFRDIMNEISRKYNIPVYDLHNKYAEMEIWSDLVHVAYNPEANIYTNDIFQIIKNEIEN